MNKQNILILAIVVTVALIPVAYSVTEPNIIIDMVIGQTTNPISILNSTGHELFAVFPDGSINGQRILYYEQDYATEITITTGDTLSNPLLLAHWVIDNGPITEDQILLYGTTQTSVLIKRDSGAGNISFGWFESTDNGATWENIAVGSGASASYTRSGASQQGTTSLDAVTDIAFMMYNSNGSTTGSTKSNVAIMEITILTDMTLTRII